MRPIAIETYKVRDTRHNTTGKAVFHPRCANVSYILRGDRWITEEHLQQSEANGRAIQELIYRDNISVLLRHYSVTFHRQVREINYYRVRAAAS